MTDCICDIEGRAIRDDCPRHGRPRLWLQDAAVRARCGAVLELVEEYANSGDVTPTQLVASLDALAEAAYRAGVKVAARTLDPATSGVEFERNSEGEEAKADARWYAQRIRALLPPSPPRSDP